MKYLIYILSLVLLVGCEFSASDIGPAPDTPNNPGPTKPIKRRPIVPGDKIERPRIVDVWSSNGAITLGICWEETSGDSLCVTLRSVATGEQVEKFVTRNQTNLHFDPLNGEYEYILVVKGEDIYYEEQIVVEEL